MFINEPRLSDFKQVLLKEGIQAEFVGGVLVCNNMVAVRRVSVLPVGLSTQKSPSAPKQSSLEDETDQAVDYFEFPFFSFDAKQSICFFVIP